jgi:hypothetical protein
VAEHSPDHYERALMFAAKVDELALLVAGEPVERLALLLDAVHDGLEDVLSEEMLGMLLECIVERKVQLERNATIDGLVTGQLRN